MASQGTGSTEALDDPSAAVVPDALFRSVRALFKQLAALPADCDSLVVGNVSVESFRAIETARPAPPPLPAALFAGYRMHMGLDDQWVMFGAATLAALSGVSAAGQGEADSSGGPWLQHDGSVRAWPTLVIEAGVTQTLSSLRMRARWWFTASDYAMKAGRAGESHLGYLLDSNREVDCAGAGAATPRCDASRAARRQLVLDQELLINWIGPVPLPQTPVAHRALEHFAVEGAPLVLRFQDLMDRQPIAATGEHDVSVPEAELQFLAHQVWYRV
ncbi:hypothetical protein SCUCBS95973_006322 [Sporothrix curviconia]|uniref:Uncharacterized protein n=1 Tax=Sporothrix curviconia TaxID=1260050 RepID=A0ABP0C4Q9_9PEZI